MGGGPLLVVLRRDVLRRSVLTGDRVSFGRGAREEGSVVENGRTLGPGQHSLNELMEMATDMGAGFSGVPVVGPPRHGFGR